MFIAAVANWETDHPILGTRCRTRKYDWPIDMIRSPLNTAINCSKDFWEKREQKSYCRRRNFQEGRGSRKGGNSTDPPRAIFE